MANKTALAERVNNRRERLSYSARIRRESSGTQQRVASTPNRAPEKQGQSAAPRERAIRVIVRADSPLERAGLEAIVRAGSLLELVDSAGRADVVLERVSDSALEAQSESDADVIPRVVLAGEAELGSIASAVLGGESAVRGILPAWASEEEIRAAITAAASGLLVIHREASGYAADALENRAQPRGTLGQQIGTDAIRGQALSPRETEILNLLADGLANKEIAFRLRISEHTVKFHVTSIFTKLDVTSRAAAVAIGIRTGLISL
jgi:two-component system, NarL family, response regulator YdfI